MTIEGIRLKFLEFKRKGGAKFRKKKINKEQFTIISNNCWGGETYESYNLIKQSPTVGLFFWASDYIKFISDIHHYLNQSLEFIDPTESKYYDKLKLTHGYGTYPVAKLGDIEIFFMHYSSEQQVTEKWKRRIKRIDWNHILYKFNDQNGCTEEDIRRFSELRLKNKICFTVNDNFSKFPNVIKIKAPKSHKFIRASYEPFGKSRYIDINKLINSL